MDSIEHVKRKLRWVLIVTAACVSGAQSPLAVPESSAVYLYQGADRQQRLVEMARKEQTLVLYTSLATTESVPLTQAFEKKYGIKVQLWRSLSESIIQRALNEARAQRHTVDVIETNSPEMEALGRENVIAKYFSPHFSELYEWAVPAHHRWISDRVDLWVVGFNTNEVKREDIPSSIEGFLDRKWKGRLAIEATDDDWMATLIKAMGDDKGLAFFRQLAAQKPQLRKGHVLLAQLVAAGEISLSLTTYSGNAESAKRKGAPIDWVAVDPVVGRPQALGLAANAPHPHAALLFADFVLSREGAELLNSLGRVPTNRNVETILNRTRAVMVDPAVVLDEAGKWQKIWNELFSPQGK
jgi:iron(III) transport system substrate-binding protein